MQQQTTESRQGTLHLAVGPPVSKETRRTFPELSWSELGKQWWASIDGNSWIPVAHKPRARDYGKVAQRLTKVVVPSERDIAELIRELAPIAGFETFEGKRVPLAFPREFVLACCSK